MNLSKLNFAQLYKLQSSENLMRVIMAYHRALRRAWETYPELRQDEEFSVVRAQEDFPEMADAWRKVLHFLRGDELKKATRLAADKWPITLPPELGGLTKDATVWTPICTLEARRFPNRRVRHALAGLIMRHCELKGVVAFAQVQAETDDFRIVANCNAHGPVTLLYQSGLQWGLIWNALKWYHLAPFEVLPWLTLADLKDTTRVNPMQWPANTPDVYEHGKELAYND